MIHLLNKNIAYNNNWTEVIVAAKYTCLSRFSIPYHTFTSESQRSYPWKIALVVYMQSCIYISKIIDSLTLEGLTLSAFIQYCPLTEQNV